MYVHHATIQAVVRGSETPSTDTCGMDTPNLTPVSSWQQNQQQQQHGGSTSGSGQTTTPMHPTEPWAIDPDELEIVHDVENQPIVLGTGGCGEVLRGVRGGVQDVAVKVLAASATQGPRDALVKEVQLLKDLRDRNVVQFYGAAIREGQVMLVTEYMPGGRKTGRGRG